MTTALGSVRFMSFGSGPAGNYSWYTTSGGRTLTGLVLDNVQYLQMADTSAAQSAHGVSPFSARWLAPWLAAHTGLEPVAGLWVVNIVMLAAAGFAVARLAHHLTGGDRFWVLVAVLVWSLSFPVLWYSGKPLVDATAVALMTMAMLAAYRRHLAVGLVMLVAAVWAKEIALVLVPVVVTRELLSHGPVADRGEQGRRTGWLRSCAWVVAGGAGYVSAVVFGRDHDLTFASWIPSSIPNASRFVAMNLGSPGGLLQFAFTAVPGVLGVVLWFRSRRAGRESMAAEDAMPLVVGVCASVLLSCWSVFSALWDGRTVWTSLPMGAVLIAGWGSHLRSLPDWRRVIARIAVVGAASFGLLIVAVIGGGLLAAGINGSAPGAVQVEPRFSAPELVVKPNEPTHFSGDGGERVTVDDAGPVLLEFSATRPVELAVDGEPLVDASATDGQVLIDRDGSAEVEIATTGKWTGTVLPVDRAMSWEGLSPVAGNGPRVLLFPGGLANTVLVDALGDPAPVLRAVGRCRMGECPDLKKTAKGDVVVPAGSEALIIDSPGAWKLVPVALAASEQAHLLAGTRLR